MYLQLNCAYKQYKFTVEVKQNQRIYQSGDLVHMFTFYKNCVHRFVCAHLSSDEQQIVHLSMVVKSGKNRRTCYKHIDVLLVTVQKHLPCLTRNSATRRFRKCDINFDIVMYLQTYFVHVNWKRHELFQTMIGMCRFNITKIII